MLHNIHFHHYNHLYYNYNKILGFGGNFGKPFNGNVYTFDIYTITGSFSLDKHFDIELYVFEHIPSAIYILINILDTDKGHITLHLFSIASIGEGICLITQFILIKYI